MARIVRLTASLLLVVAIFFFGLPKIADFSKVWTVIGEMTWIEISTLVALSMWNIATYWLVMIASLPGSNVWQTMKVNQASTAVANTLPGGGALGIGITYSMYTSYGFAPGEIGLSVLVSGVWNNFVKLGMPVVALGLLVLQGDASTALMLGAGAGVAMLAVAVGVFAAILSSEKASRRVGRRLGRIWGWARRVVRKNPDNDVEEATVRFRGDAIHLVRRRWLALSFSTLVSHLSLYLVLVLTLRHVGVPESQVTWIETLAAFASVRLLSALPITPGGLGVVELGLTAALIAAGGPRPEVVAAVLVYRALTYLLPIPTGMLMYLKWRGGSGGRKARLDAALASAPPAPGPGAGS